MMDGLNSALRQYLECRRAPKSYDALLQNIRTYESRGLQRETTATLPTASPDAIKLPSTSAVSVEVYALQNLLKPCIF